jgi:hypothetical protein
MTITPLDHASLRGRRILLSTTTVRAFHPWFIRRWLAPAAWT